MTDGQPFAAPAGAIVDDPFDHSFGQRRAELGMLERPRNIARHDD